MIEYLFFTGWIASIFFAWLFGMEKGYKNGVKDESIRPCPTCPSKLSTLCGHCDIGLDGFNVRHAMNNMVTAILILQKH